jgi:hypothetical protein
LGPADRRSALRPDVCRHPIEKLDLTVEEDDGHLRPRFVVNGRPTGLAPRLNGLAGGRGEIGWEGRFHRCPPTRHAKTPSFALSFPGRQWVPAGRTDRPAGNGPFFDYEA